MRVTFETDWRRALRSDVTASHRSTTSSRRPGAAIEGTVWRPTRQLVTCDKCHRPRIDLGGPHAPLSVSHGVKRDCVGDLWVNGVEHRKAA